MTAAEDSKWSRNQMANRAMVSQAMAEASREMILWQEAISAAQVRDDLDACNKHHELFHAAALRFNAASRAYEVFMGENPPTVTRA